jgi:hypothetical protein
MNRIAAVPVLVFVIVGFIVAFRAEAGPVDFTVPGLVSPLEQKGDTCWATTATMLVNWKNQSSSSIEVLCKKAGPVFEALYGGLKPLPKKDKAAFIKGAGLAQIAPASYSVEGFTDLLKKRGALWVTIDSGELAMTHAVLVTAIKGDGTIDGTTVTYADPATGKFGSQTYGSFVKEYENAAGKSDIQLVYAP